MQAYLQIPFYRGTAMHVHLRIIYSTFMRQQESWVVMSMETMTHRGNLTYLNFFF